MSGSCPAPFPTVFFAASPKPRFLRNKRLAQRRAALAHLRPSAENSYIRVSTNDQNTDLQRIALQSADCELIFFEDRISGKTSDRPGLKKALRCLQPGDTLVVWKLDRLGRSMRHLVMLTEELRERGVNFRSLTDSIDTSTPMGRFFFHVMGALAEMERELIVERTRRMLAQGETLLQVSLVLDVSEKTIYRYIPAPEQKKLRENGASVVSDTAQQPARAPS